jgi:hypothetical protein
MLTYLPCHNAIDSAVLEQMFVKHVVYKRDMPDNITTNRCKEYSSQLWARVYSHLGINHRPLTAFHPQRDFKLGSRSKWWSSTSEQFLTTRKTTGSNCNHQQTLCITSLSTILHWWHHSGRTTITIVQCNFSIPRTPVSDYRCSQPGGWHVWKRLTDYNRKSYSTIRNNISNTQARERWPFRLGARYSYQPGTWKHQGLHRSWFTHAQDDTR